MTRLSPEDLPYNDDDQVDWPKVLDLVHEHSPRWFHIRDYASNNSAKVSGSRALRLARAAYPEGGWDVQVEGNELYLRHLDDI